MQLREIKLPNRRTVPSSSINVMKHCWHFYIAFINDIMYLKCYGTSVVSRSPSVELHDPCQLVPNHLVPSDINRYY